MTKSKTSILVAAISLCTLLPQAISASPQGLLVPVNTNFSYWDHHWIMWTPQHPVYEAIEVMVLDDREMPQNRLIRLFFTERAAGKKQVYYFSDRSMAQTWRGEAYHRNMEYIARGEPGHPLDLILKFQDKDNQPVEWVVDFDKSQSLNTEYSGLKDQGGHGAETVFLLFYNGPNAVTRTARLLIGGKDYSSQSARPGEKERFYTAAYSRGVYTPVISYGESSYTVDRDGLKNSWRRTIRKVSESESGFLYRSDPFGYKDSGRIEIEASLQGEIRTYRHRYGEHSFKIEFDPALPSISSARQGQSVQYRISLDGFDNLAEGVLSVKRDGQIIQLDWQHQTPAWTRKYHFQTSVQPNENGYTLAATRKR